MNGDLYLEQKRLEEEATLTGIRRAARAMEKAREGEREATTAVGAAMVKRIVGPMTAMFLADLEKREKGKSTKGGSLLKVLRDLDPHLLCVTACRAALNRMSRPEKLAAIARRIGEAMEDELRWHRWEQLNRKQAEAVRRRVNASGSARQRHNALAGFARRWEQRALADAWSSYRLIGVGLRFVDYLVRLEVLEQTKIATRIPGKARSAAHAVRLSPAAAEWAKEMGDLLSVSRPLSWPLVIPPVPWAAPVGGGFHFREGLDHPAIPAPLRALPLVRRASKEQRAMLNKADLGHVYAALNAAQATAWRINPRVFSTLTQLIEIGRGGPGLTVSDPKPIPERPAEADTDQAVNIAWKSEARKAHHANSRDASKRIGEYRVFSTARKFVVYPEIYFAYALDFRGRMYAQSDDLSPQGNDLQRGLLEFAGGDPLDAEGLKWLKVHLANCYGVDKVSFAKREQWADENEAMILAVAADPLECRAWHDADKKSRWQFLAACFAYADYKAHGLGVICRVPVMLDGSCSGIQHYAALLRDAEAGAAVNLVPADKPGDLYSNVSKRVMELLAASPPEAWTGAGKNKKLVKTYAGEWLAFKIDRKIVKRSVMVLPYGGTFLSNLDYVRDTVRERMDEEGAPSWLNEDNEQEAFGALAKFVWAAMHDVVKEPINGMKWVQSVVRAWSMQAPTKKFGWVSPCGFPVVTDYRESKEARKAEGNLNGCPLIVKLFEETDTIRWSRVETAAAPNFVHSLDASHLILSLARAARDGVGQLAVVHDAFGTTPTKTGAFARILREEFSKLYKTNQFEVLVHAADVAGVEVPTLLPWGHLNPEAIARSEYLFA